MFQRLTTLYMWGLFSDNWNNVLNKMGNLKRCVIDSKQRNLSPGMLQTTLDLLPVFVEEFELKGVCRNRNLNELVYKRRSLPQLRKLAMPGIRDNSYPISSTIYSKNFLMCRLCFTNLWIRMPPVCDDGEEYLSNDNLEFYNKVCCMKVYFYIYDSIFRIDAAIRMLKQKNITIQCRELVLVNFNKQSSIHSTILKLVKYC